MGKLSEGDPAPCFTALDQDGQKITLESFRGKKVVLYFYPKDQTPGCTDEACDLRDNYARFKEEGFEVIGVSADSAESHRKFISRQTPYHDIQEMYISISIPEFVRSPSFFCGNLNLILRI